MIIIYWVEVYTLVTLMHTINLYTRTLLSIILSLCDPGAV